MKEAIIVDVNGLFVETTLVNDELTGVSEIIEKTIEDSEETEKVILGYQVAVQVPEGLHLPKWDFENEKWIEGLTPEEIEQRKNTPQPVRVEDRVTVVEHTSQMLEVRTQGMQDIDEYALQMQIIIDDRTQGMQEVDTYALDLIFDLQSQLDEARQEIAELRAQIQGGSPA
ncbi:hypothetical protein [Paenibacillus naphthalenovorans]|uniref:hypothetical protein n=1 Tax=Paenibacillus naphthalenovorans TaxID=162209 RepID=UPI003D2CDCDF